MLLEEFAYTSVPLNGEDILKRSSPARRKLERFQQEISGLVRLGKD